MGTQDVDREHAAAQRRFFITRLLHDIQALEVMIAQDMTVKCFRHVR
jgi:hypothetical protein